MEIVKNILVAGDPILDVYHLGKMNDKRFEIGKTITKLGGAANTYLNCANICSKTNIKVDYAWGTTKLHYPSLTRYVDSETDEILLETWSALDSKKTTLVDDFYSFSSEAVFQLINNPVKKSYNTLVISDYNKGGVNRLNEDAETIFSQLTFDLIVADSRYGTISRDLIDLPPPQGPHGPLVLKILHATNDEIGRWDDLAIFDWVVQTHGKDSVDIYKIKPDGQAVLEWCCGVPNTPITDTVGAGDTFTAALAAHLTWNHSGANSLPRLIAATEFAIKACQDVIRRKYVAITKETSIGR